MNKALFVDFETTSLNPKDGFVIEVAAIQMSYESETGKIKRVLNQYWSYNDPGIKIPEKIKEITNINDDMVKGKSICWDTFNQLVDDSDIVIAHNANFDERWAIYHGDCKKSNWACSVNLVNWKNKHGFINAKLDQLVKSNNIITKSHRAIEDVRSLIKLLRLKDKNGKTYFKELIDNYNSGIYYIAVTTSYSEKEKLKKMNFRWDPKFKRWFRVLSKLQIDEIENELKNVKIKEKIKKKIL